MLMLNNVVTIPIDQMDTGQGVEIIYYSAYVDVVENTPGGVDASAFEVSTNTDAGTDGTQLAIDTIATGKLRRKDGSGTMMVTPMYVEIADSNTMENSSKISPLLMKQRPNLSTPR